MESERLNWLAELADQNKKAGIIGGYCEAGFPFYYANEKMASLLGYATVEELLAAIDGLVIRTIHPDDLEQVERDLGRDYYEGMTYETTYRMPRKDGTCFWVVDRGQVIRTEDDRLAIISICTDMTDFVRRQKELEAKSAASDYLFRNMPGGYHRCGLEEGYPFLYVSEQFLNILGWTEEELHSRFDNKFYNLLHPDDRELAQKFEERILNGEGTQAYQNEIYRLQCRDGYHWISDTTVKASISGKSFFHGYIADISDVILEREQRAQELEQLLVQSERRYEIINALSKVYKEISVMNLKEETYTVVSGPSAFAGKTGPLSEMQRFFLEYNIAADQAAEAVEFLDFATLPQRLSEREFVAQDFQGKSGRWFMLTFIATKRDDRGQVTQVMLTARDITEQKAKEAEYQESLKRAAEAAQRANDAKATFLRHMSHDIRTPINGIVGLIEMANRSRDDKEKLWEYRRKTETALEYLLTLVNNILDMGKLEASSMEMETVPFDLQALFDKNMKIIQMQAGDHDVRLITKLRITHRYLLGSPTHLSRILTNLTSNAIKFNRAGGTVTVTCTESPMDEAHAAFAFRCTDTGIGISEEFQSHLFEPFAQEGKESITTYTGSGLGLAVVKATTEQMGGTVTFQSEEGCGTTFTVTIPFALAEAHQMEAAAGGKGQESPNGKHALLVEDNELNLEIAEMLLADEGLIVTPAHNGQEALRVFQASEPGTFDFIFMDIMMPVMDGLEATRQIRSLDRPDAKTVAIIAMSANAFDDDIRRSLEAGMNAHLTKPVEIGKLHQTILQTIAEQKNTVAQ